MGPSTGAAGSGPTGTIPIHTAPEADPQTGHSLFKVALFRLVQLEPRPRCIHLRFREVWVLEQFLLPCNRLVKVAVPRFDGGVHAHPGRWAAQGGQLARDEIPRRTGRGSKAFCLNEPRPPLEPR